jgi:hypothetical protein
MAYESPSDDCTRAPSMVTLRDSADENSLTTVKSPPRLRCPDTSATSASSRSVRHSCISRSSWKVSLYTPAACRATCASGDTSTMPRTACSSGTCEPDTMASCSRHVMSAHAAPAFGSTPVFTVPHMRDSAPISAVDASTMAFSADRAPSTRVAARVGCAYAARLMMVW